MTRLRRTVERMRTNRLLRCRYCTRQLSHAEWYVEFHRQDVTDAYVASRWGTPTDGDVYADRWLGS